MGIATDVSTLDDSVLLAELRTLVRRSTELEADLLEHLAEVDERRLYLPDYTSMFAFCLGELGFSESSTEHRLTVARQARRFPRILELLRAGKVHLSGLRVLAAHLTAATADGLLEQACGRSKRAIEEIVAHHAPRAAVPDSIRKVPERPRPAQAAAATTEAAPPPLFATAPPRSDRPALVAPLAPERYHVHFTASRALRDKIEMAKALLRHQNPTGDLASILDQALTLLI